MKRILLACFYLAAFSSAALAQFKIPAGNFSVKFSSAEIPADWKTDSVQPAATNKSTPSTPVRFAAGRQGDTRYERLEFKDGTMEEVWLFESWLGWKSPKGELLLFDRSKPVEEGPTQGFFHLRSPPGLEWVKAEFLVPTPKGKGEAIDYYAAEVAPSPKASPIPSRAWIDSVTGTPKIAQRGKLLFTYQFGDPMLIPPVPAELAEQAKSRKKVGDFIKSMRRSQASER
jgi:hypothetical protein